MATSDEAFCATGAMQSARAGKTILRKGMAACADSLIQPPAMMIQRLRSLIQRLAKTE